MATTTKPVALTREQADALTQDMLNAINVERVALVYRAHALHIWEAYGLKDWAEYVSTHAPILAAFSPTASKRRELALDMYRRGSTQEEIAEALGISQPSISRAIKAAEEAEGSEPKPARTRKAKPLPAQVQNLLFKVLEGYKSGELTIGALEECGKVAAAFVSTASEIMAAAEAEAKVKVRATTRKPASKRTSKSATPRAIAA